MAIHVETKSKGPASNDGSATGVEPLTGSVFTQCGVCGNLMRKLWRSGGHQYFVCSECEFVRVTPVPRREVLREYYDKAYEVDREGYLRNLRRDGRRDLEFLERLNGAGRMLEVGCSWGFFLEKARSRGWQVQGIELSDSAVKWAKESFGLDVRCGTIEDTPLTEKSAYDVVVAWHVIEHVQEPMDFLKIARGRLRPGGLLALRTPNVRSVPARITGWAWQWVGAPAHLSLFSPKSLGLAVERAGFIVRHVATRRGDAHNPFLEVLRGGALRAGVHERVKGLLKLQHRNGSNAVPVDKSDMGGRRSRILGRMSKLCDLAFFAMYPLEKLLDFSGLGPEMFLVAERKD
jgi:2-polyprenyl-3-methyl-5-hydroxy-6-metoxy-1,4-benzoquinol methylase